MGLGGNAVDGSHGSDEHAPVKPRAGKPRVPARAVGAALLLAALGSAASAHAETSADDKAVATALFQEGRALMVEGRIPEACLKLEESQRLDPGGGTILNLALCHEQERKLALSWSEFKEALAFARRDHRADREAAALEHVAKLEPRLSRLTVVVPEAARVAGMRIERDGRELGEASWSLAIPVDGAEHVVRATAPGRLPYATTVALGAEGGAATVEIPLLVPAPAAPPLAPAVSPAAPSLVATVPVEDAGAGSRGARRTAGWIAGAAGLVQLGAAGYFGVRAFQLHPGDDMSAGRAADRSTVFSITGLVTLAPSVYLLVTSRR